MAHDPLPPRSHVLQAILGDYDRTLNAPSASVGEVLHSIERVRAAIDSRAPYRHQEALAEVHHFLTTCLLLPLEALRQKYEAADMEADTTFMCKAKEYQLQAVLRLHIATLDAQRAGRPMEDPLPSALLAEVVQLLQVGAFSCIDTNVGGFQAALHPLLSHFVPTLPQSLLEIYGQLEIQPPPALLPESTESHLPDELDFDLLDDIEADPTSADSARAPSPAPSLAALAGSTSLHPLLSRARSFSTLSTCSSENEFDIGHCSQASTASGIAPLPRKLSASDTARKVLQSIQAPNTSPQPVDLSSGRAASDLYSGAGIRLLRHTKKRPAPPAPPVKPVKKTALDAPTPPETPFWELKVPSRSPEMPSSPPRRWGSSTTHVVGPPRTPDRRGRSGAADLPSPVRLTVDETPPRARATGLFDLGTPAKLIIYESD
eukprot:GGOE01018188.1.p1 GENE.GGOE01018188.1~~GGOE01018188.1.p1  ORF type:complete len:451 (-),score=85.10 GGOE01018188.1:15-1310(-)